MEHIIQELHLIGDVFVTLEKGAAWNIPAMEAYNSGNLVICTKDVQPSEFLPSNGYVDKIDSVGEWVDGMSQCSYPGLYTGSEAWWVPDEHVASSAMRVFFEEVNLRRKQKHDDRILSPDLIAEEFKEILA